MNTVTPNEIARRVGISGPKFRSWLRDKWRGGDPRLSEHRIHGRWFIPEDLGRELEREYRSERGSAHRASR